MTVTWDSAATTWDDVDVTWDGQTLAVAPDITTGTYAERNVAIYRERAAVHDREA